MQTAQKHIIYNYFEIVCRYSYIYCWKDFTKTLPGSSKCIWLWFVVSSSCSWNSRYRRSMKKVDIDNSNILINKNSRILINSPVSTQTIIKIMKYFYQKNNWTQYFFETLCKNMWVLLWGVQKNFFFFEIIWSNVKLWTFSLR